jgi:hypothetical protein
MRGKIKDVETLGVPDGKNPRQAFLSVNPLSILFCNWITL